MELVIEPWKLGEKMLEMQMGIVTGQGRVIVSTSKDPVHLERNIASKGSVLCDTNI
jgi:hypothetical protein